MINDEEKDHIGDLKKRLYQRGSSISKRPRTKLSPKYDKVKTTWEESAELKKLKKYSGISFLSKLLLASFLFFLGAIAVAGFILWQGSNIVSNRHIDLLLKGPVTVKAGDEVSFQIIIANANNVSLEEANLVIEYPPDSRLPNGATASGNLVREEIGNIRSGETINKTAQIILFGQENANKEIKATLEYRIPGSNAFYEKTEKISFIINSPPISLTISTLPEVVSDQEVSLEVTAVSNATTALENILLSVAYPFGFKMTSTSLKPDFSNNIWSLGTLKPGEKKTIVIKGTLAGQDQELKTFTFTVGNEDNLTVGRVADIFSEKIETILIKRPFINTSLSVNGRTLPVSVLATNDSARIDIEWTNNLPTAVVDAEIVVELNGVLINKNSVSPGSGFYRSVDNSVVWHKSLLPALAEIAPGASGKTSFIFNIDEDLANKSSDLRNPAIDINLTMKAIRISEGFQGELVETKNSHKIKIESDLQLATKMVYNVGPFVNTGALPPKVDQETTYTTIWTIVNSSNLIREATVKTILPPSVRWTGAISPSTERITYNKNTGEVVWQLDRIEAGTNSSSGTREVAFQIGFTPSSSQVDIIPDLTGDTVLVGRDDFTGTTLRSLSRALSTRLVSDPNFDSNKQAIVVQ